MAASSTIFMTTEESERIQTTVRDLWQKRQDHKGQPWKPCDPRSQIQEATARSLLQDLSCAALGLGGSSKKDQETIVAYGIGLPYFPSSSRLQDLVPMKLSDLRMETNHRGRVLFLRRVSPVVELKSSSWAIVQADNSDEVERLEIFLHKSQNGCDFLSMGFEFSVKEPYYTLNNQGQPTIRIDHPSDLVLSTYSNDPESWRRRDMNDRPNMDSTAMECKNLGNSYLQKQDNARALAYYTKGLEMLVQTGEDDVNSLKRDLYRNRSHVNLLLERYDHAITDAFSSLTHGEDEYKKSLDAKAYFRAGTAAYNLGNFGEAKRYFEEQERLQKCNKTSAIYLNKVKLREREMASGVYDIKKATGGLSKTKGRLDAAAFIGRTEIKSSPGSGRGLYSTEDIETNGIIMCEKAFCVDWGGETEAFSALTCDMRDNAAIRVFPTGLHQAVVEKLLKNPSQVERVLDLFGDYAGLGKKLCQRDGTPLIDTFQIHDIIQRNAFGTGQQTGDESYSNSGTGLWIRASYINHSCVGNAKKDFVGDLMIIRAVRKIFAGEEITHSYYETNDYEERRRALDLTWGFCCKCRLCMAEVNDNPTLRKKRLLLEGEANVFIQRTKATGAGLNAINRAKRLLQLIDNTYDKNRYKGLPRKAVAGIEEWLQIACLG